MHRDYFDNSGEIMIEVFRNKLIISNPGGLVKSLKPEMFGKVSRTRNSLVAGLLSRTEFVERMGTGISRIKRAMKKFGLPKPEFFYDGSFLVTLYDKSYVKKTVVKTVVKTVGKTVGKILALIEENPKITREELSVKIGLTIRGIEWNLAMLKKKGLLKRIGPKKGGYWEVVKKKKRVKK